jgi:hypothetical protein
MASMRSHTQKIRNQIDAGNMGRLADETLKAAVANHGFWGDDWCELFDTLRDLPMEERRRLAHALIERFHSLGTEPETRQKVLTLLGIIARDLPDDFFLPTERLAELQTLGARHSYWHATRLDLLAEAELATGRQLAPSVVAVFRRTALVAYRSEHLVELVKKLTTPVLNVGEAWADHAMEQLTGSDDDPWHALLVHALTATASKPSAKWDKQAQALIDTIGADRVGQTTLSWLALVGRPRTIPLERQTYEPDINNAYDPYNANALRGLAWLLSLLPPHPDTARALGALVETSLKKVAGMGPRNPKVANAGVIALSRVDSEAALAELARLATRVTYKNTAKLLDVALEARATALGLSREEIEELAVPAYGLTEVGRARHQLGDVTALIEVHGTKSVLGWRNAAGKEVKSVPAAGEAGPRRRAQGAQGRRQGHRQDALGAGGAAGPPVPGPAHLGVRRLARALPRPPAGRHPRPTPPVDGRRQTGRVRRRRAAHTHRRPGGGPPGSEAAEMRDRGFGGRALAPVGREPAEIVAWRDWLERHEITQPFKQAHREVYLLTDAERATGTYSNRFAAHVLRQHQFNSLAAIRGWRNKLRLCVDDSAPPASRELPQWGLRAEYWIEGDGEEYGEDTTESGSYLRLRTDQVRFYPIDAPENSAHCYGGEYSMWLRDGQDPVEPLPLTDIPPLALSEVLRDVDLFVGVASVGNDPTWQDGGPGGRFQEYWSGYSFGELNQSAETRRALLDRLIPRLAIADRCTLEGRFLHVKGERHTYKIHLGSGNILMTPNDQYLCIVPKSAPTSPQTGYLPYEGDRTLAVILSKAMMLAKDTEITDPTILSQL